MTFINLMAREINCKIVYYGPGLCGKTTNLEVIHNKTKPDARGKMVSLATETERTLFFDFMPIELGTIRGFKTRFHLYTVPGQVFYDASRKLILKGVDGCVFVADSQMARADANEESLENLKENLAEYGMSLDKIPYVVQYNKRDLPGVLPVEELRELLNPNGVPDFEAVAPNGTGVFETLKAVARLVFVELKNSGPGARAAKPAAKAAPLARPGGLGAPPMRRPAPAQPVAPAARPVAPAARPVAPAARPVAPAARPVAPAPGVQPGARRPAPPLRSPALGQPPPRRGGGGQGGGQGGFGGR